MLGSVYTRLADNLSDIWGSSMRQQQALRKRHLTCSRDDRRSAQRWRRPRPTGHPGPAARRPAGGGTALHRGAGHLSRPGRAAERGRRLAPVGDGGGGGASSGTRRSAATGRAVRIQRADPRLARVWHRPATNSPSSPRAPAAPTTRSGGICGRSSWTSSWADQQDCAAATATWPTSTSPRAVSTRPSAMPGGRPRSRKRWTSLPSRGKPTASWPRSPRRGAAPTRPRRGGARSRRAMRRMRGQRCTDLQQLSRSSPPLSQLAKEMSRHKAQIEDLFDTFRQRQLADCATPSGAFLAGERDNEH